VRETSGSVLAQTKVDQVAPLVSICVPYFNLPRHLPETLASLDQQTYPHLEVLVIDDGSTQPAARRVFDQMSDRYRRFRFVRQNNAGIGATRNRGLCEARGELFLPMDADNIARPDMVERFVAAIWRRPDVAALTCYFLAFATDDDLHHGRFLHAYRPTGGPHVLACLRNVYGDATAIYRTEAFRSVGGYETDRGSSFEDWEAFVKLIHAGHRVDVVPDHLFYYRHLPTGFSRVTSPFANHERIVRQFRQLERLPRAEREALWDLLTGVQLRLEQLDARQRLLRYRLVDRFHAVCASVPFARTALRWLRTLGRRTGINQRY
jgi:glycosyltransferase involved in cell wall biosynthesis